MRARHIQFVALSVSGRHQWAVNQCGYVGEAIGLTVSATRIDATVGRHTCSQCAPMKNRLRGKREGEGERRAPGSNKCDMPKTRGNKLEASMGQQEWMARGKTKPVVAVASALLMSTQSE